MHMYKIFTPSATFEENNNKLLAIQKLMSTDNKIKPIQHSQFNPPIDIFHQIR